MWRDQKPVAMLHNVDMIQLSQDMHKVLRMSPKSKKKKEVDSPRVISSYASNYNGVDRKDRDTSDWTVSVKSHRWYLRLYYWMIDAAIHSSYLLVVNIAKKRGETNPEHPWLKYSCRNGRMIFQLHLANSLMEKGLLMDCPDVANFKKPNLRPRYSRKKDYHPCECEQCFFCKYRITYGVQHKKPKAPRFRVPLPGQPESPQVPPPPPSQHPSVKEPMGSGPCDVCKERLQKMEEFKGKNPLTESSYRAAKVER